MTNLFKKQIIDQHCFTVLRYDEPEMDVQCPVCLDKFFVSPHTEEGLYYDTENSVLKIECPSCGCREK